MSKDPEVCTVTMARIYEKQGHLQQAAQIYRLMLQQQPERQELKTALAALENPPAAAPEPDLVSRFSLWMQLAWRHQRLEKLSRWQQRLSDPAGTQSD
jgi:hypothetical protein